MWWWVCREGDFISISVYKYIYRHTAVRATLNLINQDSVHRPQLFVVCMSSLLLPAISGFEDSVGTVLFFCYL